MPVAASRHLFYVHSHLTAAVALAVIAHEKLAPETCAVLFDRGYQRPLPAGIAWAPMPALRLALKAAPWALWRQLAQVDDLVRSLTGGQPFHLYAPHLYLDPTRVLFTNRQCVALSYLEEGLKAYLADVPFHDGGWAYRVGRRWLTGGRVPSLPAFPPLHARAYGLHPAAFPTVPAATRVVLPYPFATDAGRGAAESLHGAHILAFDALAEMGILPMTTMEAGVVALAQHLRKQKVTRLHYKPHPRQMQEPTCLQRFLELLRQHSPATELVLLPASPSLEDLAGSFRGLTFYVAISSVGFYATLARQRVVSFARVLAHHTPAWAPTVDELYAVHGAQVEFLPVSTA